MRPISVLRPLLALSFLLPSVSPNMLTASDTTDRLLKALKALQDVYFFPNEGTWITAKAWNSAVIIHMLANLAQLQPDAVQPSVNLIFETVYQRIDIQSYPSNLTVNSGHTAPPGADKPIPRGIKEDWFPGGVPQFTRKDWNNTSKWSAARWNDGYHAHALHWALAWIAAADVDSSHPEYMKAAIAIFEDVAKKWDEGDCGGLQMGRVNLNTEPEHINNATDTMATMLFYTVAATLANHDAKRKAYYVEWANKAYDAIFSTPWTMHPKTGLIPVSVGSKSGQLCMPDERRPWTATQGIAMGGLIEMAKAVPSRSNDSLYIAELIADTTFKSYVDNNNTLHEFGCEWNCDTDGQQYKGIFMRYLSKLQKVRPHEKYVRIIRWSVWGLWTKTRMPQDLLTVQWWGNALVEGETSATQSSGMEALVAELDLDLPELTLDEWIWPTPWPYPDWWKEFHEAARKKFGVYGA